MSENKIKSLVDNFYREFAGLPNHRAIVRNNTPEDAFTLAILKVMYGETLDYEVVPENVDKISKVIVAPPDSGIDLFMKMEMNIIMILFSQGIVSLLKKRLELVSLA